MTPGARMAAPAVRIDPENEWAWCGERRLELTPRVFDGNASYYADRGLSTLDVDVLLVGDERIDEPDLQVPHPRMWERSFVLVPLHDLALDLDRASEGHGRGVPLGSVDVQAGETVFLSARIWR